MSNDIQKIQNLEKQNNENKLDLAKLLERKKVLDEENEKILKLLKEKGIEKGELEQKTEKLKLDLSDEIEKLEEELK